MKERSEIVERALAMLTAAPRRTTVTPATDWRDLASITAGLEADDARLTPVLAGLAQCQKAYEVGDFSRFLNAAEHVRRLMLFTAGSQVRWHGHQDHRLMVLGPAVIEDVQVLRRSPVDMAGMGRARPMGQ